MIKIASNTTQLINPESIMNRHFYSVIYKEINPEAIMNEHFYIDKEVVTESHTLKNITAVNSAVLFHSESKSSSFYASKHPYHKTFL